MSEYICVLHRSSACPDCVKEIDKWKSLAGELVKAVRHAIDERILGHPMVEAGAMEDLEVMLAKARESGL